MSFLDLLLPFLSHLAKDKTQSVFDYFEQKVRHTHVIFMVII